MSFCGEVRFGIWLKHHGTIWKLTRQMQNDVFTTSIAQICTLINYALCLWLSFGILGDVSWVILCQRWWVDWGRGCLRYQTPAQFWLIKAGVFGFGIDSDFKHPSQYSLLMHKKADVFTLNTIYITTTLIVMYMPQCWLRLDVIKIIAN